MDTMKAKKQELLFRNNSTVFIPTSKRYDNVTVPVLTTFLKNLESLGYTLKPEVVNHILNDVDLGMFLIFADNIVNTLRKELGAHVKYNPFYPNFPQQVMEADEAELYFNAFMHYFGSTLGYEIFPDYTKTDRKPLKAFKPRKMLGLANENDYKTIFTQLVGSKTTLSESNKSDLLWFIKNEKDIETIVPENIPNKETLAYLIGATERENKKELSIILFEKTKTATDILRVLAGFSDSDVSLTSEVKFISLPKKLRRAVLSRINQLAVVNTDQVVEDMKRNTSLWKIVGEKLHPGDYRKRFPYAWDAFNTIRNDKHIQTFSTQVEKNIDRRNIEEAVNLLVNRPGDFARRLDALIRKSSKPYEVINRFATVADKVSTPVLWQVRTHFLNRTGETKNRVFVPKGNVSKIMSVKNKLEPFGEELINKVISVCDNALGEHYKTQKSLGKVFVSDELKNFTIPQHLRSATKALKVIGRGSRFSLGDTDIVRFFMWWKENGSRADLDLSADMLDEDFNYKGVLSYYNLRGFGGAHSGDITSAPRGASEFIDVSLSQLQGQGIRYVSMVVTSFTGQPFNTLEESFAGVMARKKPQSGEVYEPSTVENVFDVTSDTKITIPLVLDVMKKEFVWGDLALNHAPSSINVANNLTQIGLLTQSIVEPQHSTLYDLFFIHALNRGEEIVDTEKQADTVFTVENGISNIPFSELITEWL